MPQFEEGTTLDRFILKPQVPCPRHRAFATLQDTVSGLSPCLCASIVRDCPASSAKPEKPIFRRVRSKLDITPTKLQKGSRASGVCCAIVSEEDDEPFFVPERFRSGRYIVCIDPLDGSSNIDVNATIGTIFRSFAASRPKKPATLGDILQSGREMVAAGYVIYGSGTVMVLSTGQGVMVSPSIPSSEIFLSHPNITLKPVPALFGQRELCRKLGSAPRAYIEGLKTAKMAGTINYIGSLVADFTETFSRVESSCTQAPPANRKVNCAYSTRPFNGISQKPLVALQPMESPLFLIEGDGLSRAHSTLCWER